ncbi:MAG: TadE/TadG family type IV pilus assembly protein [Desulfobaccales bacterium]
MWSKLRESDGAMMVEIAIGISVLLLVILGIMEFGYLWYQKQVITNASREGARYGVTYQTNSSGNRVAPKDLNPSIQTVVSNYLNGRLPSDAYQISVTNNTGYLTGTKGSDLIIRVTCQNKMDLLSGFIPQLATLAFQAQTIMKCE